MISVDTGGMVEYWRPEPAFEQPDDLGFQYKSTTDLYEFRKYKCLPSSLEFSPDGSRFATFSLPDRQIRVFDFRTGKLHRKYDESLAVAQDMQTQASNSVKLDDIEFGKRIAIERELEESGQLDKYMNVIFDESGHFIAFATYYGIKSIYLSPFLLSYIDY